MTLERADIVEDKLKKRYNFGTVGIIFGVIVFFISIVLVMRSFSNNNVDKTSDDPAWVG